MISFLVAPRHVFSLVLVKHKIIDAIVAWVSVYVVNNLFRIKISANMLFHYQAMLKNVFKARGFCIRWVGMVVRDNNKNIAVLSALSSPFPLRRKFFSFAVHRVVGSMQSKPLPWSRSTSKAVDIHWVIFPAYVSMICRVFIGQVGGSSCAAFRTIQRIRATLKLPKRLITLGTVSPLTAFLSLMRTLSRTILELNRWICLIIGSTGVTRSSDHSLNYTVLR